MKAIISAAAGLLALGLVSASANAAVVGMAKDVGAGAPALELETVRHGTAVCALGPRGWHYHNRFGDRIPCNPRPRGVFYTWRCVGPNCGWWHRGYRRFY